MASPPLRVLEFGCGEGRVLLELQCLFPDAEIHGVSKDGFGLRTPARWLRRASRHHGLTPPGRWPTIHCHDADDGLLPFLADARFDVVVSQVSIGYVARKDRLIEEFWRVLKPGGRAFLDLDNFVVLRSGNEFGLARLAAECRAEGFDLTWQCGRFSFLVVTRNRPEPLCLRLQPFRPGWPLFADTRRVERK
jgi:SAM-dependent methyltransferase